MGRNRFMWSVLSGLVFITLGFNRPQQQWTWFGLGAGFILLGVLRWMRSRDRPAPPSDGSPPQL